MNVSPLNHGSQPPLLNAQTNALAVDHTSAETLLIHKMHDNTLLAGKDKLLDVLPVQTNCCKNGTHVCLKANTSLNPNQLTLMVVNMLFKQPKANTNCLYTLNFLLLSSVHLIYLFFFFRILYWLYFLSFFVIIKIVNYFSIKQHK